MNIAMDLLLTLRRALGVSLVLLAFIPGWGNNITILNDTVIVSAYQSGNPGFRNLTFTVKWDNSWNKLKDPNNIPNRDAAWIFVKYRKHGTATWHHAYLGNTGHSSGCGNNCNIETALKSDGSYNHQTNPVLGVFFYRNGVQSTQYEFQETLTLKWNCESNSDRTIGPNDQVEVRVYAVEMVYVPQGEFTAGRTNATNTFRRSLGGDPYKITSGYNGSTMRTTSVQKDTSTITFLDDFKGQSDKEDVTISNINIPAGQDKIMLVGVAVREKDPVSVNSVKFNGTPLDFVVQLFDDNKYSVFIYRMVNPSGNGSVVVDLQIPSGKDAPEGIGVIAAIFSGVNQDEPTAITSQEYNAGGPHDISISSSSRQMVFDMICSEFNGGVPNPANGQTLIDRGASDKMRFAASYKLATPDTTTMTWSLLDDNSKKSGLAGVALRPAVYDNPDGIWVDGDEGIKMIQNGVESEQNLSFPTGYKAFYCMKYEIMQGQYAAFLNTLTLDQQKDRVSDEIDIENDPPNTTFALDPGADSYRNYIRLRQQGGAFPARFGCDRDGNGEYNEPNDGQYIACNFLLWNDVEAWLDWAALRPMTELEYEKACRGVYNNQGDETPVYPWGNQAGNRINGTVGSWSSLGTASEVPANGENMAVHFNQAGSSPRVNGPFRVGGYARPSSHGTKTREIAGVSLPGVVDLAGNLWEGAVSLSETQGRSFLGGHGDGDPATVPAWPGSLAQQNLFFGIIRRGSAWDSNVLAQLMVSNRPNDPLFPSSRAASEAYGGRGVRSAN